ncbi:MAG: FecR domain-containing protein [Methylococcales bacterium]|nr:FecR domain-containing protein [Methylococcales bacterium]
MKTSTTYFLYIVLIFCCQNAMAEIAANVIFTKGEVFVIHSSGEKNVLKKGSTLEQGDTIETKVGYLQLRFTDGGLISFYDNTEFKIEDYHFSKGSAGKEKAFFHFAKGVFRTIVGSIKKDQYQVRTNIASIGTRGTEYSAKLDNGLHINVFDGTVILENQAGNFSVASGHSALMPDIYSRPQFLKLDNRIQKSLSNKNTLKSQTQPSIDSNTAPEPETHTPSSINTTTPDATMDSEPISLDNNLPHNNPAPVNTNLLNNDSIPSHAPAPRHRELDDYQEPTSSPAPITTTVPTNSSIITIENVLNSKIAPEELPPPEAIEVPKPLPINEPLLEPAPINKPIAAPINAPIVAPTNEPIAAPTNELIAAPTNEPVAAPISQPAPTGTTPPPV